MRGKLKKVVGLWGMVNEINRNILRHFNLLFEYLQGII
jgi:hypothetical protein